MKVVDGKKTWWCSVVLSGLLLTLTWSANASIITYNFFGTVTELVSNGGLFGSPATVGGNFSGHFSYDTGSGNPDQLPADLDKGVYNLIELVVDNAVNPLSPGIIGITLQPGLPCVLPCTPSPGANRFSISASSPDYASGIILTLLAPFGTVFVDDSLPETLNLTDFTLGTSIAGIDAIGIVPAPSIWDVGVLTSLTLVSGVPEPTSLILFGLGLTCLVMVRRRKHI